MASDLIYREDAKDFVRHAYTKGLNPMKCLDEVPIADVRPVIHGEWMEPDDDYGYFVCSICEERSPNDERWNFCPNCGTNMQEEKIND